MGAERERIYSNVNRASKWNLARLSEWAELQGDRDTGRIFADLLEKEKSGELVFAFCGHFSAGKSSMINALCGIDILPSGPLPTSANAVSIRRGTPRTLIYRGNGETRLGESIEASAKQLREYCRLGNDYTAIEVWEDVPLLGLHGVLMDTPGVDSTEEGHQSATHSALHLADIVFYIMDYNHVQSEINLAFAKNLSDWGKPLYLIINQIDKHREQEISIEDYRKQVESAFHDWGVKFSGLLFTSLKEKEHPLSGLEILPRLITELLERKEALLEYSLSGSIEHTAEAYLSSLREGQREERESLLEELGGEDPVNLERELADTAEKEKDLETLPERARHKLRASLDGLLSNANLMPADIREAVSRYADSLKPGFRTGLLTTAAKRERERSSRLSLLADSLERQVSAQLEGHVLSLLRSWGGELELWSDADEVELKNAFPQTGAQWLAEAVKPGTPVEGEALLQFCRVLAAEIRSGYRRAALGAADGLLAKLPPLLEERRAQLARRKAACARQAHAAAALAALTRAYEARAAELAALLPPRHALTPGLLPEVSALPRAARSGAAPQERPPLRLADAGPAAQGAAAGPTPALGRRRLGEAAQLLAGAASLLSGEPAMGSAARSLTARAADLAGGRFTLALFGAFSAGKSSFANALLGEEVLPVSPHPATAAVNRILAPAGPFRHATAEVTMKNHEEVWDDIRHSFGVLQLGEPSPGAWADAVSELPARGLHPSALPHAGFLRAAARGWNEAGPLLGTVRTVELDEYRKLVAEESRACFVRGIDLYYACPLTESGIVLVDTPGADSLHARHTGVTFSYMKEADAICFVTYYNHAFSKADRQLLSQLGRIRESGALDKMFVIVNASDLASDEAELAEVKEHVAGNLRSAGLTNPRIFALSSLQALEGKTGGDRPFYEASRFAAFEAALWRFAGEELPALSLKAAMDSLASVRRQAEEWLDMALKAESEREDEIRRMEVHRRAADIRLAQLETEERPARDLRREGGDLLYHVHQRLGFSFGRMFQESFHPSLLRDDGGGLKDIFAACGRELWRTAGRELEGELWATTLRLTAAGRRLVREAAVAAALELGLPHELPSSGVAEDNAWPAPEGLEGDLPPADWGRLWGLFKSPKHFFEGGGRDALRNAVEPQLKEALASAASKREKLLLDHYESLTLQVLARASEALREMLEEKDLAMSAMREGGDSAGRWSRLIRSLRDHETAFGDLIKIKV
ncbi:GTPase Era, involved in 16S rRNA processing [Paenibacillus sophorae]|uniref:Dynamin family protein n=1 Tax=Paenibacillus sophorae TaxID=1333845 RepID=A0A1H8NKZ8_9BACL|nr:dynamin family protein [Paenibacillus sophorae]QWU14576.1 dynamin family protein [Paenibacillus sophorae]SEO30053.1 GTPase Era, involved in 16S rRNA processing [Paenibacillus sophorae]